MLISARVSDVNNKSHYSHSRFILNINQFEFIIQVSSQLQFTTKRNQHRCSKIFFLLSSPDYLPTSLSLSLSVSLASSFFMSGGYLNFVRALPTYNNICNWNLMHLQRAPFKVSYKNQMKRAHSTPLTSNSAGGAI